jgi:hypothetical protein
VKFIFNSFRYKLSEFVRIAKVQTVNITSKGDNLTGKISGGYVCLTGPLKKTSQGKPRKHNEWYDEDHDGSGDRATKNTLPLPDRICASQIRSHRIKSGSYNRKY